jgi:6-phosphogluconolactonase
MTSQNAEATDFIPPTWQLFRNATVLAQQATLDILNAASAAIAAKGAFHIVLAGGTTPKHVYQQLAESSSTWENWHIYLGDERCLPANDPERNSVMAHECFLNKVSIPKSQIHFMQTELGSHEAASAYSELLSNVKCFDMVLLGMGEDGHTASLFPGHVHNLEETVHAVSNAPKAPAERVSLSSACLSNNDFLLIFITGQSKHERVIDWISSVSMPVNGITSKKKAAVYCDHSAWLGSS